MPARGGKGGWIPLLSRSQADFENKRFIMSDCLNFLSLGTMDVSLGTAAFPRSAFCGVLSYPHFYQNWISRIAPLICEVSYHPHSGWLDEAPRRGARA